MSKQGFGDGSAHPGDKSRRTEELSLLRIPEVRDVERRVKQLAEQNDRVEEPL